MCSRLNIVILTRRSKLDGEENTTAKKYVRVWPENNGRVETSPEPDQEKTQSIFRTHPENNDDLKR